MLFLDVFFPLYLIFILWVIWPTKLICVSFGTPNYIKGLQSLESDLRSSQRNGLVSFIGPPWFSVFFVLIFEIFNDSAKALCVFQLSVWLTCVPFQQNYQFVIGTDTHAHQVFHSFCCVPGLQGSVMLHRADSREGNAFLKLCVSSPISLSLSIFNLRSIDFSLF